MNQSTDKPIATALPPNGLRVLVVDDEQALADLVGSYLTRDGFDVSMAHDGQQAIDQARRVDPDVMVLDLGLPVIDGVEVCRVVRTFSDCYIVMLTARSEEIDPHRRRRPAVNLRPAPRHGQLTIEPRPPYPPFSMNTAIAQAQAAEDAWNTRDPDRESRAFTVDSIWRNRDVFLQGREDERGPDHEIPLQ